MRPIISMIVTATVLSLLLVTATSPVSAQTTNFTYQGRLNDGGTPANGNYDLQFTLWDSSTAGSQVGATQTINTVPVTNGVFTVQLDFGAGSFSGANRFLEIGTRASGAGSFTLLTPRQPVTSTPYAVRSVNASSADALSNACSGCVKDAQINSLAGNKITGTVASATTATNAAQLGGVAASQYVQTGDARLADARPPAAGSANYIQNTSGAQTASFNISGNGTAGGTLSGNVVNAATQYNLGGNRVFAITGDFISANSNTFVGFNTGLSTVPNGTAGIHNSFFGNVAGSSNTSGAENSFFGSNAGRSNTQGSRNSSFGDNAGASNSTGSSNSFFGFDAGASNSTGNNNSFFGFDAGEVTTTGNHNLFAGDLVGFDNKTGSFNVFLGGFAVTSLISGGESGFTTGQGNTTGSNNTALGSGADFASGNLTNATTIGYLSQVAQSNSLVLGSINGTNGATADTSVGIGTTAPKARLHVVGNVRVDGDITLSSLGAASSTQATLCRNTSSQIAFCNSSSLRYKKNISTFTGGMAIVNRLRPISFIWKQDGVKDIGFGAEEVERVAPMFTFKNDKGQIEGVRYDRLGVLFVNALKEEQEQLKLQQQEIEKLQAEIHALRAARHRRGKRR